MGASKPKIPDPSAETPGVILGDRGFALSHQLAELTGQSGRSFRQRAAARSPSDPVSFLRELLKTERKRARNQRSGPELPSEPPERADPSVQAAGRAIRRRGSGRASTILTALEGSLPSGAAVRKTLLGGS